MRILVTGASGFIGATLIPRLARDGHEIVAFGRDEQRMRSALAGRDAPGGGVRLVSGDALRGDGLRARARRRRGRVLPHSLNGAIVERIVPGA